MNHTSTNQSIDAPFAVPFVHRLRFASDVFAADQHVLADLLQPDDGQLARVQFWIDGNVLEAQGDLRAKIREFCQTHEDRLVRVGSLQIVPGGEAIKNDIHLLERMLKVFHAGDLDRRSYVVVIGGGAVLDAVGFAAAIAHRGLRLVRLPTTTLSQGDSGIGVKNGVNLFNKKNWLGSFAVPWAVVNDAALLRTLAHRDFVCGFSEALKVGLLKDAALFELLCDSASQIRKRDMAISLPIIQRSAEIHLDHIVAGGDPFEMFASRPLDFGHWSAHKMEAMSDFELRHGEAVAIGVAIDVVYSSLVHGLPREDAERAVNCLAELGLPLDVAAMHDQSVLFAGLEEFRQHLGGRLTLTMLRGVGDPLDVHEVDLEIMSTAIDMVMQYARDYREEQCVGELLQ